jgi:hypothetical protein
MDRRTFLVLAVAAAAVRLAPVPRRVAVLKHQALALF